MLRAARVAAGSIVVWLALFLLLFPVIAPYWLIGLKTVLVALNDL